MSHTIRQAACEQKSVADVPASKLLAASQLSELATPFYLYDFDEITARYQQLRSAFEPAALNVFYAIKANSNISLLRHLASLGSGFDCVSANEIRRALLAGAAPYRVIFSGVGKTAEEIKFALSSKILYINAESQAELELIEQIASELGVRANISLRINPNVDAKTHPYISTGLAQNKFGVDITTARMLYLKANKSQWLNPIAAHFHIGSQLLDLSPVIEAASIIRGFLRELASAGLDIRFFDIGGGFGVAYEPHEREPDLAAFGAQIRAIAGKLCICCEPGRYLVAGAGKLLSRVLYEKQTPEKRFVICDASMAELMRPSLYGAHHAIAPLAARPGQPSAADVVGGVCESGDFLGRGVLLAPTQPGDLLAISHAGAYAMSMASNYNSRTKAAEWAIFTDQSGRRMLRQIARAQSFSELIAAEIECL